MKEYTKPIIEEEAIELEDIIAYSNLTDSLDSADEKDPFDMTIQ